MDCLFCKIAAGEIPVKRLFEDEQVLAFPDINPQAPVHLLVIPKKAIATLNDVQPEDAGLVGGLFPLASRLVKELGYSDFRAVFNCGAGAQQTVFHLHLHVLAGRAFTWPPG